MKKYRVDKIIHFVWAGGESIMPTKGVLNMLKWTIYLPKEAGFEIWLWVDPATDWNNYHHNLQALLQQTDVSELVDRYQQLITDVADTSNSHEYTQVQVFNDSVSNDERALLVTTPIILKNARTYGVLNECANYEIIRPDPNYGASSDLIRYDILHEFGGLYLDVDIVPVPNSFESFIQLFKTSYRKPIIVLNHVSQQVKASDAMLKLFKLPKKKKNQLGYDHSWGNDAILCSAYHPLMRLIIESCRNNYHLLSHAHSDSAVIIKRQIERAYCANYTREITISTTGPVMLAMVMSQWKIVGYSHKKKYALIKHKKQLCVLSRFNTIGCGLLQPVQNHLNWLKTPRICVRNEKLYVERMWSTIHYEAKFFGVLRMQDHLLNIAERLQIPVRQVCESINFDTCQLPEETRPLIQVVQNTVLIQQYHDFLTTMQFHHLNPLFRPEHQALTIFYILKKHIVDHWISLVGETEKYEDIAQKRLIQYLYTTSMLTVQLLRNQLCASLTDVNVLIETSCRNMFLVNVLVMHKKLPREMSVTIYKLFEKMMIDAINIYSYTKVQLLKILEDESHYYGHKLFNLQEVVYVRAYEDATQAIKTLIELLHSESTSTSDEITLSHPTSKKP